MHGRNNIKFHLENLAAAQLLLNSQGFSIFNSCFFITYLNYNITHQHAPNVFLISEFPINSTVDLHFP
jgi:hypothetical protein